MKGIEDVVKVWHIDSTEGLGVAAQGKFRPGLRERGKAALKYIRAMCLKKDHHHCYSNNCSCACHKAMVKGDKIFERPHKPPTK